MIITYERTVDKVDSYVSEALTTLKEEPIFFVGTKVVPRKFRP